MPASSIKESWKEAWRSPIIRRQLIIIFVLIPVFFTALPIFFTYIEKRPGVLLNDWVLAHIPAVNVSVPIFAFIWSMMGLILYRSVQSPAIFIKFCITLAFVTTARILCIWLVPLAPPVKLVTLTDPLTGIFYGEAPITKDLFFSGHTALLMVIYFSLERKTDKLVALISACSVMVLLFIQHIHYTIDVLAAPVIVYVLYRFSMFLLYGKDEQGLRRSLALNVQSAGKLIMRKKRVTRKKRAEGKKPYSVTK